MENNVNIVLGDLQETVAPSTNGDGGWLIPVIAILIACAEEC